MSTEPLPTMLDVRKAAARGATVSGTLKPLNLQRFLPLLAGDDGAISVVLAFSRDEENRYLVRVKTEADVVVTCQRCLENMPEHLSCDNTLAIVWTDEEAAHLPKHLEPVLVSEASCDLWELVEDELILGMPPFSYHDQADCRVNVEEFSDPAPAKGAGEDKPNPFSVLGQLKPGNE